MSHRVWTKSGISIIVVTVAIIITLISLGGCGIISKVIKEIKISRLEEPSQDIPEGDLESLENFKKNMVQSQEHLKMAMELEKKYPEEPRPRQNREAWEKYISRLFSALQTHSMNDQETEIHASTFADLQKEYRRKVNKIDVKINLLKDLKLKYTDEKINDLLSQLDLLRQEFRCKTYPCPEHEVFCKNCISREEKCQACGGDGKWKKLGCFNITCKLCEGTGRICSPGKTYCPECKGRWDEWKNCKNCNYTGLVPCTSHNEYTTKCSVCGTPDGKISGQSLEP